METPEQNSKTQTPEDAPINSKDFDKLVIAKRMEEMKSLGLGNPIHASSK